MNKWAVAARNFCKKPDAALVSIESSPSYWEDEEGKYRVVTLEEARNLFAAEGIRVLDIYAVCGWLDVLRIPDKVLQSRRWDEKFFQQTKEMALKLSKEPSVKGMSRHLVLYGQKRK